MAIHSQPHDPDWYLRSPRMRKWLVQCVTCQRVGYRADAPNEFFDKRRITHNFQPLLINEAGICPECQAARSIVGDVP